MYESSIMQSFVMTSNCIRRCPVMNGSDYAEAVDVL